MGEAICQLMSGVKAFKGKGAFRAALFESEGFLQQVHSEIERISDESRSIDKRPFFLEVHKPVMATWYRAWKLRWRLAGGRNGHTQWEHLGPQMQRMSIAERRYYENLNDRMMELNAIEGIARMKCKYLREYLEQIGDTIPAGGVVLNELNRVRRRA